MRINIFTSVFILAIGILLPSALFEVALAEESEESAPPNGERTRTRDEQDRHIKIEIERQKMESARRLMGKKKIEVEKLEAMMMEENNIVTVAEVNTAKEDYEKAVSDYEQAKLELQRVELESYKMNGTSALKRHASMNLMMAESGSQLPYGIVHLLSNSLKVRKSSEKILSLAHRLTISSSQLKSKKVMAQVGRLSPNLTNNGLRHSKRMNLSR